MTMRRVIHVSTGLFLALSTAACGGDDSMPSAEPLDPDTAPQVMVDRFTAEAGTLMVRTADNGLPGPDEPVDFDVAPFVTQGLGPAGEVVRYYNFDVMPTESAPIFVLIRDGESAPVDGQLNIIDVVPGDEHYNDFWHVHLVTVPSDYVANTVTSLEQIQAMGYPIERTETLVNCPVVPAGSTASMRFGGGDPGLVRGWYRSQVVHYFDFSEAPLTAELPAEGHPPVPVSPIFVMFAVNPDESDPASGPASGFRLEEGTEQTHNVVATLPGDEGYSPLWMVNVLDNGAFDTVMDLETALAAPNLGVPANVNCPIVEVR